MSWVSLVEWVKNTSKENLKMNVFVQFERETILQMGKNNLLAWMCFTVNIFCNCLIWMQIDTVIKCMVNGQNIFYMLIKGRRSSIMAMAMLNGTLYSYNWIMFCVNLIMKYDVSRSTNTITISLNSITAMGWSP